MTSSIGQMWQHQFAAALGVTMGLGVYAFASRMRGPLTASRKTLIKRLKYRGGRKYNRALKRLGLRRVRNPVRNGPRCSHCGVPTVVGCPTVCETASIAAARLIDCAPTHLESEGETA